MLLFAELVRRRYVPSADDGVQREPRGLRQVVTGQRSRHAEVSHLPGARRAVQPMSPRQRNVFQSTRRSQGSNEQINLVKIYIFLSFKI